MLWKGSEHGAGIHSFMAMLWGLTRPLSPKQSHASPTPKAYLEPSGETA